jgi:hypothetical protein
MVVLLVASTFLFFVLLDLVASKARARRKAREARDVRFVPELGFVMADGGKPAGKK